MSSPRRVAAALSFSVVSVALGAWAVAPDGATRSADAAAPSPFEPEIGPTPPDPPPSTARQQWVFDLRFQHGDVMLLGVHPLQLDSPQKTPRAMGRFALELFEGKALVERVRFDFPLLGAGPPRDAGVHTPPSLEAKLTSRIGVLFPAVARGTRLELCDRATGRRWQLPWPPREPHSKDAGSAIRG